MLFDYQLKVTDLYNIPIGNAKKLVPYFFDKKKCDSLRKYASLLNISIEAKENTLHIRIQSKSMAKTIC